MNLKSKRDAFRKPPIPKLSIKLSPGVQPTLEQTNHFGFQNRIKKNERSFEAKKAPDTGEARVHRASHASSSSSCPSTPKLYL